MSHSQWEKKKYKKAAQEGKVSQLYGKLVKVITMEAKKAAGNRESPGLKSAIAKAREVDMPAENIERAIKRATEQGSDFENITYEAYGPGGVAMIIEALTTNHNKAAQEIKHILSKNGFPLGAIGSATWAFTRERTESGIIWNPTSAVPLNNEDKEFLNKLVNELESNDEVQDVFTNAE